MLDLASQQVTLVSSHRHKRQLALSDKSSRGYSVVAVVGI
jgi:hypothetical protein